ncbi:aggregation factor core [uncultured Shimia sp.]|uniref:aggregation factor core n=1 Tax=uncultured Shimia sp. TaxID=573152 RepID=UPI00260ED0A9|nr:aggregation factor core [uncultured Shimia sp.]
MGYFLNSLSAAGVASMVMFGTTAQADLRVSFDEGAPKDRFRIENTGACAMSDLSLLVDLAPSQGGLIFDVTSEGQGVEVFQPFEIVQGAEALDGVPKVTDGQTEISLDIVNLAPNEAIAFTIDVDDTLGQRAITVSGAEIQGAVVSYVHVGDQKSATFSTNAEAKISGTSCS